MEKKKAMEVINKLITINNNRLEGYSTAAAETEEQDLRIVFTQLAQTSEKCKHVLIAEIHKLGGMPSEGTKIKGIFFREWMDVKAALIRMDRKAILNSCEYGEDGAIHAYKKVLENERTHLSMQQEMMIRSQYHWILADYDTIKKMRYTLFVEA